MSAGNESTGTRGIGLTHPAGVICEVVDEATALLADHVEDGKHTAEEVIRRLWSLLHEQALLVAMHAVGHFPVNTPPPPVTKAIH